MRRKSSGAYSPTLETIRMVERTIRDAKQLFTVAELKRKLPKKVHHYTLKNILEYLDESGKIAYTVRGVVWVFATPPKITALLAKGREWK